MICSSGRWCLIYWEWHLLLSNLSISALHWSLPLKVSSPRYLIDGEGVSLRPLGLMHKLILSFCLGFLKMLSSLLFLLSLILMAKSKETRCFRVISICFWIFWPIFPYINDLYRWQSGKMVSLNIEDWILSYTIF